MKAWDVSVTYLDIPHRGGKIHCEFYHMSSKRAVICLGGVGGGTHGPANIYHPLAENLASDQISTLLVNCRHHSDLDECTSDILACIDHLDKRYRIDCIGLVGWSFGGGVVISAAAWDTRVKAVITVASQTYGTEDVDKAHAALLLLHGMGDTTLPYACSIDIEQRAHGPKKLVLLPEGDHGISQYREEMLDMIRQWMREWLKCR